MLSCTYEYRKKQQTGAQIRPIGSNGRKSLSCVGFGIPLGNYTEKYSVHNFKAILCRAQSRSRQRKEQLQTCSILILIFISIKK